MIEPGIGSMDLLLDIGNTNLKWAWLGDRGLGEVRKAAYRAQGVGGLCKRGLQARRDVREVDDVFGRRAGIAAAEYAATAEFVPLPESPAADTIELLASLRDSDGGERVAAIRSELQAAEVNASATAESGNGGHLR